MRSSARCREAALEDFPGCAVVISHDRFFFDRLATHTHPHRIKFKRFERA